MNKKYLYTCKKCQHKFMSAPKMWGEKYICPKCRSERVYRVKP